MDPVPSSSTPPPSGSLLRAILVGGFTAAAGDLVFAIIHFKTQWDHVARMVARGVLSKELAYEGPSWVVALGLSLHVLIGLGAATVFVLASRKLTFLARHPGPVGLAYGVAVYLVMSWVVVPLSAITLPAYPPPFDWKSAVGHMVLVGLPITLSLRWFGPRSAD